LTSYELKGGRNLHERREKKEEIRKKRAGRTEERKIPKRRFDRLLQENPVSSVAFELISTLA
jgi:hypothetical protein